MRNRRSSQPPSPKSQAPSLIELIAKVWEIDPLICPRCGSLMFIKALTDDPAGVKKVLAELDLWTDLVHSPADARSPPESPVRELSLDLTESQIPIDELFLN